MRPSVPAQGSPRIQSLDGLRALSILLVIYGHARATRGFPETEPIHQAIRLGNVAHFGVRVFFVISGFLITSLLAAEIRKSGTVRLGSFFLKRAFRIFPAYYFYLGAMGLLSLLGLIPLPARDVLLAATYTVNYALHRAWWVGHAWSLSVEEQFYLLWPLVLRAAGAARGLRVAIAVVALGPLIRVGTALVFASRTQRSMIAEMFPTVADSIAMGCVLALARERLEANERYMKWLGAPLVPWIAFGLSYAMVYLVDHHVWIGWIAGETVLNTSIALLVHRYVQFPGGRMGRVLNSRPLVFIGTMSYSLYLWQQPFLVLEREQGSDAYWTHFPQNVVFMAVASLASYYLIEKPSLRLRDLLVARPSRAAAAEPAPSTSS